MVLEQLLQCGKGCVLQYVEDNTFLKDLAENTKRFQNLFAAAADKLLDPSMPNSIRPNIPLDPDTFDVLMNQVSSLLPHHLLSKRTKSLSMSQDNK